MHVSTPSFQFIPPPPRCSLVTVHLFSMPLSVSPLQVGTSIPFFQIPLRCVNTWYSFSPLDWLQSVLQTLGPSTSLQMMQPRSFLWLCRVSLYIYLPHILHSSLDGRLGCCHIMAIVNPAAVSVTCHVSFWIIMVSTPGVGDRQGGLACHDSWGRKESDTTERLNWTELNWVYMPRSRIAQS